MNLLFLFAAAYALAFLAVVAYVIARMLHQPSIALSDINYITEDGVLVDLSKETELLMY